MQPHPPKALVGCKALKGWPNDAFLVPGLICCNLLNVAAGKVCNDDDLLT